MSAAENKKLIEDIFNGLANQDGALLFESMADDVRWIVKGSNSWCGIYEGKQAVLRDLIGPLRSRLRERPKTLASRIIAEGDCVIVEAGGANVTKEGKPYRNQYCFVIRIVNGKIREYIEYADTELVTAVLGDRRAALAAAT